MKHTFLNIFVSSFAKIFCVAFVLMAVMPCCSKKQNPNMEWTVIYSADSLFSLDVPQGYDQLVAMDMSTKYCTFAIYDQDGYSSMICVNIWHNNDNLEDFAEGLLLTGNEMRQSFIENSSEMESSLSDQQWKKIKAEDSLVVFKSKNGMMHNYYLLKESGSHTYIVNIISDFNTKKLWNVDVAKEITNSIQDHTKEVMFSSLTAMEKDGKWVLNKSGFAVDTCYEYYTDYEGMLEMIRDYRELGPSERLEALMPRGAFAFESKDEKCFFFVGAYELPISVSDTAEIVKCKLSFQNNGLDFIEQKKGTCTVIKCKEKDVEDGKVMEVINVFKGKRMWSIGLFHDADMPGITDKVLGQMRFFDFVEVGATK